MPHAHVAIVGSGVIGASIAWHLASFGVRDVVVVDRGPEVATGSTSKATGGFRAQFESEINVRLSLLSRAKLVRFADEVGADPGYEPSGYLFLARDEAERGKLQAAIDVQRRCGFTESEWIGIDEVRTINPFIEDRSLLGGTYSPTDGFIRALKITRGYATAAQKLGVRFLFDTPVGLVVHRDFATGVRTSSDVIEADIVVNASGAWAADLCDVPVRPLRRNVLPTVPTDVLPATMPMTIWVSDGFHLRVRDGRVLLLQPHDPASINDEAWCAMVESAARERVPILREVATDRAGMWNGLYEMSPDGLAIVGPHPHIGNLFLANGSSGHGVMHAPAIGQLVAEMITGAKTSIDVTALRPTRFIEGTAVEKRALL